MIQSGGRRVLLLDPPRMIQYGASGLIAADEAIADSWSLLLVSPRMILSRALHGVVTALLHHNRLVWVSASVHHHRLLLFAASLRAHSPVLLAAAPHHHGHVHLFTSVNHLFSPCTSPPFLVPPPPLLPPVSLGRRPWRKCSRPLAKTRTPPLTTTPTTRQNIKRRHRCRRRKRHH